MEKITAKNYCMEHFKDYPFEMKDKSEMLALLNILQASGENLDTMHNVICNGYDTFMDIFGKWDSDLDLYKTILEYNTFFTEDEYKEFIKIKMVDLKELEGIDNPEEEIRTWLDETSPSDTKIIKTEDGYVLRVWC